MKPTKQPLSLSEAILIGDNLIEELSGNCHRIEIAGSIRRESPTVKDIEIVCVPCFARDLFGDPDVSKPHMVKRRLEEIGVEPRTRDDDSRLAWGTRYLAGVFEGAAVDVFCVFPPAHWGVIKAIRTGPASFAKTLVSRARSLGYRVESGRLLDETGAVLTCETESQFFAALGLPKIPPDERT